MLVVHWSVQGSVALTPRATLLARRVVEECAGAETPEDIADAAAFVIDCMAGESFDKTIMTGEYGAQGEFRFDPETPYSRRYETAKSFAMAGDAAAAQTLGLLLYNDAGGAGATADNNLRESAHWHARAAALGNLDGLAVLGGCARARVQRRECGLRRRQWELRI